MEAADEDGPNRDVFFFLGGGMGGWKWKFSFWVDCFFLLILMRFFFGKTWLIFEHLSIG